MPERVLMCGSREFEYRGIIRRFLACFRAGDVVIHGACPTGADKIVSELAPGWVGEDNVLAFPADWKSHGKAAGPIRNQQMLDEGKPDRVIAFHFEEDPKTGGTADMIRRARKAGLPVIVCTPENREIGP